jgi:hypothetical protein
MDDLIHLSEQASPRMSNSTSSTRKTNDVNNKRVKSAYYITDPYYDNSPKFTFAKVTPKDKEHESRKFEIENERLMRIKENWDPKKYNDDLNYSFDKLYGDKRAPKYTLVN